jgi:hypothetical protein
MIGLAYWATGSRRPQERYQQEGQQHQLAAGVLLVGTTWPRATSPKTIGTYVAAAWVLAATTNATPARRLVTTIRAKGVLRTPPQPTFVVLAELPEGQTKFVARIHCLAFPASITAICSMAAASSGVLACEM